MQQKCKQQCVSFPPPRQKAEIGRLSALIASQYGITMRATITGGSSAGQVSSPSGRGWIFRIAIRLDLHLPRYGFGAGYSLLNPVRSFVTVKLPSERAESLK